MNTPFDIPFMNLFPLHTSFIWYGLVHDNPWDLPSNFLGQLFSARPVMLHCTAGLAQFWWYGRGPGVDRSNMH